MPDLTELPDNIVDLDEYRRQRVKEGTWPPDELTVRDYWRKRRNQGERPKPENSLVPAVLPVLPDSVVWHTDDEFEASLMGICRALGIDPETLNN